MKSHKITDIHIDSFNFAMKEGLSRLCEYLNPCEAEIPTEDGEIIYKLGVEMLHLGSPYKTGSSEGYVKDSRLFPSEARIRRLSYAAPLAASISRQWNNGSIGRFNVSLGSIPIMLCSSHCHLAHMSLEERQEKGEDIQEIGGYFIINGVEKLIRMLVVAKQNYPIAMLRPSFTKRGPKYTAMGVSIRCIREDLHTQTVTVHYLSDGNCTVSFRLRRGEFIIPAAIMIKALGGIEEEGIFRRLQSPTHKETYLRTQALIRDAHNWGVYSQEEAQEFIGNKCRRNMSVPSYMTDREVGTLVLVEHVFVHLERHSDKLNLLLMMIRKNYAMAEGEVDPEGTDTMSTQEILLPGHIFLNIIKEKIEDMLEAVRIRIIKEHAKSPERLRDKVYMQKIIEQHGGIGKKLEQFLATGNLTTRTGLDLLQDKGFSVVAERINYARFISHFHSVHRGAYFTEMKITSIRKLLPESWGFLCPVHTPDGSPCGLLNHLASGCTPVSVSPEYEVQEYLTVLEESGMNVLNKKEICSFEGTPVLLDGRLVGTVENAREFAEKLRIKRQKKQIHKHAEIAFLPDSPFFGGVFLFTKEGRLMRMVKDLKTLKREFIGPLEQLSLSVALSEDTVKEESTHVEISPLSMLSLLAMSTPFSDHNQSPRNMYQCQMAKQTMGIPFYNYQSRTDSKIFRLLYPQKPLVTCKAKVYNQTGFPEYPSGTNSVVAVISYTGYDMEDAMIVNKAAYERGFARGDVYKTNFHEIEKKKFAFVSGVSSQAAQKKNLDMDGLKKVGSEIEFTSPELALFNKEKERTKYFNYKEAEPAKTQDVLLINNSDKECSVMYKFRYPRNPVVGDKFSSRHGQKGVLSILWPQEDMPFTEEGLTPDIIINPHAFPSRMTIGMLIESMAGKTTATSGHNEDSKPFQYYDKVAHFGEELAKAGYSYHGTERMYSGIFGEELKADIFIGVVYYQRLRHMVSDKYQARATGPVDILTRQPIKGRKRHGGIRVGEMERDSILSHGTAYWIYDRLLLSSDHSFGYLCRKCQSVLTCNDNPNRETNWCGVCQQEGSRIVMPFVLRYLVNELAAMNLKLKFK